MVKNISHNLIDNVNLVKQREIYVPSQQINEIKKLFLWTERLITDLEKTYKEYADRHERNAIQILGGGSLGRIASVTYYIRYIDETVISRVTELEKKLVDLYNEVDKISIPEEPGFKLFRNNKRKILIEIEENTNKKNTLKNQYNELFQSVQIEVQELINEKKIQTVDEFNSSKTPIMRFISDPILSDSYINDFLENRKKVFNGLPNLFTSFFDLDPAYKYIINARELKKEIGYNIPISINTEYRNEQKSQKLITNYTLAIENIMRTFSSYGYKDIKYIIVPLLLYMTDLVYQLKTTKTQDQRNQELLDLQSYIMYSYYDYKQYVSFNKIVDIWMRILSQENFARGDWWIGNRKFNDQENRNFLFQFVLIIGDLLFQPSLIENYYEAPKYIVEVKTATEMSEVLTKQILPLIDEYFDRITEIEK